MQHCDACIRDSFQYWATYVAPDDEYSLIIDEALIDVTRLPTDSMQRRFANSFKVLFVCIFALWLMSLMYHLSGGDMDSTLLCLSFLGMGCIGALFCLT